MTVSVAPSFAAKWLLPRLEHFTAARPDIVPGKRYRFVTTDWVAKNAKNYLGDEAPALTEQPALKLKAAVIAALNSAP